MAIDRGWWAVALSAIGIAALVFPWLPGPWPNPLPQGELDFAAPAVVHSLRDAAAAVDAACVQGDLAAFTAAVTPEHRAALDQSLGPLDRVLDAAALRELGAERAEWLDADGLAGVVVGERAAIAVRRPEGDGAQVLKFQWDGQRLRFDGSLRAAAVRDAAAAQAAVEAAVARR